MNFKVLNSLLLIGLLAALISCGGKGGNSDPAPTLEGTTWKLTAAAQTAPSAADITSSFYVQTINFQAAGAYTITKPGGSSESGTYTYDSNANTIALSQQQHGGTWTKAVLSGSQLTATVTISQGKTTPITANVTYTKQ